MKNQTVLITGASSGIGGEFARIFAKEKYDLVLVARNKSELEKIAKEFPEVKVHIFAQDLAQKDAAKKVYEFTQNNKLFIDILINNAGFGQIGEFANINEQLQIDMINVNITNLTQLTRFILPDMKNEGAGKILNVASTAAFMPGPNMAVYYATKAYVLSFSEALSEELKHTGITVTTLCPGPTQTNFKKTANIKNSKIFHGNLPTAKDVAEYGYNALMNEKVIAIHGLKNKVMMFAIRFIPHFIIRRIVKSVQKE